MSNLAQVPAPKPAEPATQGPASVQAAALQIAKNAQQKRIAKLVKKLALWVVLPTLLAAVYYGFVAPDEFESSAVVVLRGGEGDASRRGVLLSEFLQSRDAQVALETRQKFSQHYETEGGMFGGLGASAGSERRFRAFLAHTHVQLDSRTGVVRVKVRAFSGEAARGFTQGLLDAGEAFLAQAEVHAQPAFTVVSRPMAPTDSTYPHRGYAVLTAFLVSLAIFGIGSLLIAAVREHAHF
jgi:capsular polysaccharide transport system permease protein